MRVGGVGGPGWAKLCIKRGEIEKAVGGRGVDKLLRTGFAEGLLTEL